MILITHAPSKFCSLGIAFAMANNSNPSAVAAAACRIWAAEAEGAAVGCIVGLADGAAS